MRYELRVDAIRFPALARLLAPLFRHVDPRPSHLFGKTCAHNGHLSEGSGALLLLNQGVDTLVETLETLSAFVRQAPEKIKSGRATQAGRDMFLALDDVAHSRGDRCPRPARREGHPPIASKSRESWVAPPQIR